uniref:ApaG domain-containing protein n=1 Tax=Rhizophora mucronata TaxID=61149 RepID=A0A2P2IU14_RHIMU
MTERRDSQRHREMGLETVGDLALHVILTKLGPEDTARTACVSKRLWASASEEFLWSRFCLQDLDLFTPLDPQGNPSPSFKASYRTWRECFGMYPWPLVKRVKRCWDRLKNWLATYFPEAEATLCKGASEDQVEELENILMVKLPLPTRILYRFCDGQDLRGQDSPTSVAGSLLGLIGGYSFYQHLVNVYLLPLEQVVVATEQITGFSSKIEYILVAGSSTSTDKYFFLNCTNGQLYVGTKNYLLDGEMIPCVPNSLINSVHDFSGNNQQDGMLLWLEEHANRLEKGIIKIREGDFRSICQFPEVPPLCSTAVTNNVKIRASAVFVPEYSDPYDGSEKYWFAYSIRMSLLPKGCIINGMSFSSCQLYLRHWIIRAHDVVVSEVNAEAVIGRHPLLQPGEKEFIYESCTPLPAPSGSVEGAFAFVPGRLADPKGGPFPVEVGQFPLQLPEYIF